MKKTLFSLGVLVVFGTLIVCIGCSKYEPVVQPQPTIIRQDEAAAKVERQRNVALQHFQEFRVAGTFNAGVKALNSMELALGSVGLTNADIPVRESEIAAHLWDLAHRKPPAKLVSQPVAHKTAKNQVQRKKH